MKKSPEEKLSVSEVDKREKDVLSHFLTSKPSPHKPLGKAAKERKKAKPKK